MNKYFNTIVFAFFSVLTVSSNVGFTLYLPVLYFMTHKNNRNLILTMPISLISMFIFNREFIFGLLIIYGLLAVYIFLLKKYNNLWLDSIYIAVNNIIIYLLIHNSFSQRNLLIYLICILFSSLIYLFFKYNITCVINNKSNLYSYVNIELVCSIISIIGALKIEFSINVSLLLGVFYLMYFSSCNNTYHSLFLSICLSFFYLFYKKMNFAFILPFISALYMLNGLWGSIIMIAICFVGWISNQTIIDNRYLQGIIYVSIFFEITRGMIINTKIKHEEIYKDAYEKSIEYLNHEVITFASFLDMYSKEFAVNKDYLKKINEATRQLQASYCNMCYMKDACFKQNKGTLHKYMTELILYSKRSDYSNDTFTHIKKCPYFSEMKKMSSNLNAKYDIENTMTKTNALVGVVNGISNILRQYSVDNTIKKEIEYNTVYKIKKGLMDLGINVCYFNIRKLIVDDFLIEIGIRGFSFSEIENDVCNVCDNFIPSKVSVKYLTSEKGKVYMSIMPKVNYSVDVGYANIASSKNNISGDNYMVKDLSDTKLIACISDGMGKGYEANDLSASTLKLIDNITNTNITSSTSLQIINTFYFIQDYLEKYSTLDYVEVDKIKGVATFYKLGAATTYLYSSNGKCKIIENKSLPFGLEESVEGVEVDIKDGDMIIMASDGMFESTARKEEIEFYIKSLSHLSAQSIVYEIINKVKSGKRLDDDDMSIIVMKLNLIG